MALGLPIQVITDAVVVLRVEQGALSSPSWVLATTICPVVGRILRSSCASRLHSLARFPALPQWNSYLIGSADRGRLEKPPTLLKTPQQVGIRRDAATPVDSQKDFGVREQQAEVSVGLQVVHGRGAVVARPVGEVKQGPGYD